MQYNQYKEEQAKLMSDSTCFCLPLRSGVLAIGLIGSTLAISGMAAYAIVQVPTVRVQVGQYFINTTFLDEENMVVGDYNLRNIAYGGEIVGVSFGTSLGLLANILLLFGVFCDRRWFLMHWLILHFVSLVFLFITSILLFVVQISHWKIVGVIPVLVAIFTMYCWTKVYELFCALQPLTNLDLHEPYPQPCKLHPHVNSMEPSFMQPHQTPQWREEREDREGREESMDRLDDVGTGLEFYPVDPLSRGMMDRLRVLNMSMSVSNMVYLPYGDVDDAQYQRSSHSREKYQYREEDEYSVNAEKQKKTPQVSTVKI